MANKKFEDVIEYTDNKEGGKKREYKKRYYPKKNKKEIPQNKEDVKDDVDSDGFEIVGSKEEKKQKLREEHRGEYAPRRGRGKWRRNKFWKRRDYENEKKEKDEEKNDKENNEENEEGEENEEEENKEDKEGKEENKEENEKDKM